MSQLVSDLLDPCGHEYVKSPPTDGTAFSIIYSAPHG